MCGPHTSESLGTLVQSEIPRPYYRPIHQTLTGSPGLCTLSKHHLPLSSDPYAHQQSRFTAFEGEWKQGELDQWAKNVSSGQEQGCKAETAGTSSSNCGDTRHKATEPEGSNVRVSIHFLALGSQPLFGRAAVLFSAGRPRQPLKAWCAEGLQLLTN